MDRLFASVKKAACRRFPQEGRSVRLAPLETSTTYKAADSAVSFLTGFADEEGNEVSQ